MQRGFTAECKFLLIYAILAIIILILLIGHILFHMLSEKNEIFYRDIRFWLVVASLCALAWLALQNYRA